MSEHTKIFNIKASPELMSRFNHACDLQGLNKSEVMRKLMSDYAESFGIRTIKDVK